MSRQYGFVIFGIVLLVVGGRLSAALGDDPKPAAPVPAAQGAIPSADIVADETADVTKDNDKDSATEKEEKNAKSNNKKNRGAEDKPVDPADAVELFGAVDGGQLDMKFIAKSDHDARVLITNTTNKPMTVRLPEAFAGVPVLAQGGRNVGGGGGGFGGGGNTTVGGGGNQGIGGGFGGGGFGGGGFGGGGFGGGGGIFSIPPEQTAKFDVAVVCLDHGLRDPSSSKPYKMVPIDQYVDRPAVVELVKAFGRGELQHGAAQAATWHLNNDIPWAELAAKQQGTVRSVNRPPYFSQYELQAGMAYAGEAARRGQLAQLAKESEQKTLVEDASSATSTAADNSREPGQEQPAEVPAAKGQKAKGKNAKQPAGNAKRAADTSATQL
jgi:hypothetical protein